MLTYLLLLTIFTISSSTSLSQSLRGGRELRPAQHKQLQKPCTLYKRLMRLEDGSEDASWECLLDLVDGAGFVDIPPDIDLSHAVSGVTTLFAPQMGVVEQGRPAMSLADPSQAVFGEIHQRDRRLAVTSGTAKVVVVRVTCGAKVVSDSLETIKSDVFSDDVCLKSQMEACSNGLLQVDPGPLNGGVDVSITDCTNHDAARNAATNALTTALGRFPGTIPNTYFMYCLPPGIGWSGIAYGYLNSWLSVYNDPWCRFVSSQVHEVGHNFNLGHAGEGSLEYDDMTGFMGYSQRLDDQRMCYNAANMYQLGWLQRVQEFSSRPSGTFSLEGHTTFGTALQAIRLQGTPAGSDTYIWFNDANGINSNAVEGRNEVIVTTRASGTGYSPTTMVAKLMVGGQFTPLNGYYSLKVDAISNGQAVVSFITIGSFSVVSGPVVRPTPSPVTPPTPPPVTPPTPSPVTPPTPAPTIGFVTRGTSGPVRAPTSAPVKCPNTRRVSRCPLNKCQFTNGRCRPRRVAARANAAIQVP